MKRAALAIICGGLFSVLLGLTACRDREEPLVQDQKSSQSKSPAEYKRPFEATAAKYYQLLLAEQFSELDTAITQARRDHAVVSDGQSLAAAIYGGVRGCSSYGCRERFSERAWQQRGDLLRKWKSSNPGSIAAEISAAGYHVEYAWDIRGADWAANVSADAWSRFEEQMNLAERELREVSSNARNDPEWSVAMLEVGIAKHWPLMQYEALFSDAIRMHRDEMMVYLAGCPYYAPRWYGSAEQLRQCVERAVSTTQARLGDTMYARINWALHTDDMFHSGQASWPQVRAGFERIVADYPDPWNINKYGYFACLAEDAPTVVELAKRIGSEPILLAWYGSEDLYRRCVGVANEIVRETSAAH
jgi:hypothetical protein